jgi:hypothetical protein
MGSVTSIMSSQLAGLDVSNTKERQYNRRTSWLLGVEMDPTDYFRFQYIPTEAEENRKVEYEDDDCYGSNAKYATFKDGGKKEFSFTLFLNSFGEAIDRQISSLDTQWKYKCLNAAKIDPNNVNKEIDVEDILDWLYEHQLPTVGSGYTSAKNLMEDPPILLFCRGSLPAVRCVLSEVNVKRIMSDSKTSRCTRAEVQIKLLAHETPKELEAAGKLSQNYWGIR